MDNVLKNVTHEVHEASSIAAEDVLVESEALENVETACNFEEGKPERNNGDDSEGKVDNSTNLDPETPKRHDNEHPMKATRNRSQSKPPKKKTSDLEESDFEDSDDADLTEKYASLVKKCEEGEEKYSELLKLHSTCTETIKYSESEKRKYEQKCRALQENLDETRKAKELYAKKVTEIAKKNVQLQLELHSARKQGYKSGELCTYLGVDRTMEFFVFIL